MSFRPPDICYTCKKTEQDLLEEKGKTLDLCPKCHFVFFCDEDCLTSNTHSSELSFECQDLKEHRQALEDLEDKLKVFNIDANELAGFPKANSIAPEGLVQEYFEKKDELIQKMLNLGLNDHVIEIALEEKLKVMLGRQPWNLDKRYSIPMMMLQLKRDDEAYNFIKFWLEKSTLDRITPFRQSHAFLLEREPIYQWTFEKQQDKSECILRVLNINLEAAPYLMDCVFYICLVVIKVNALIDSTTESQDFIKVQKMHICQYLDYIEDFFPGITMALITNRYDEMLDVPREDLDLVGEASFGAQESQLIQFREQMSAYLDTCTGNVREMIINYLPCKPPKRALKWTSILEEYNLDDDHDHYADYETCPHYDYLYDNCYGKCPDIVEEDEEDREIDRAYNEDLDMAELLDFWRDM